MKVVRLLVIILIIVSLAGTVVGTSIILSNILKFETTLGLPIILTKIKDLPQNTMYGVTYEIKVKIEVVRDVSEAYLIIDISAAENGTKVPLDEPSAIILEFTNPDTKKTKTIELTSVDGDLTGTLMSNWNLTAGYDKNMKMELTFNDNAPSADYTASLWVQSEAEQPPPIVPDYQTWRVQDTAHELAGMQSPCMGGHPVQWDVDDYAYVVCAGNTHYILQHPDYLDGQPFSPCMEYGGMPYDMEEHVLE
ncbi:MAG: hypothetical protein ACE5R6_20830 [Candidatus Heimdallarchaeota archaeon]